MIINHSFCLPRFKIHNFRESFLHCFLSLIFLFHKFRKIEYTYHIYHLPQTTDDKSVVTMFPEPEFPQLLPLLYKSGNVYVAYMLAQLRVLQMDVDFSIFTYFIIT